MHLNGWQRLWVLATIVWSIAVGISTWNGITVARLCAADGAALRYDLTGLLASLRGGRLPHCWFH